MHEPPLRGPENPLNLRNPAMPTAEDTDPTPSSSPNSTDPIFPPRLDKSGQRVVNVTAVQGPGVAASPPKESTTTEQLLSGLLESPTDASKKEKPRKRETSGENAADYSASPRPVPVGRKEKGEEAVIVAPASSPGANRANAAFGAALRARADETLDDPNRVKGTRDDRTVPLPRRSDRRGVVAFFVALLLVGGVGYLLLGRATPPAPPTPTKLTAQLPTATPPPTDPTLAIPAPAPTDENVVTADPVIESQSLKRPKVAPPRPTAPASATAPVTTTLPTASAAPPPPPTATSTSTTTAPPDFDELKKGIKH
jgi:hypothetical protein